MFPDRNPISEKFFERLLSNISLWCHGVRSADFLVAVSIMTCQKESPTFGTFPFNHDLQNNTDLN